MEKTMTYVLINEKGNAKIFKSESRLEEYLRSHEGIFYLVELFADTICVSKIYAHDGEYEKIKEGFIEMKL